MPTILFCSDMLTPRAVDLAYGTEHEAAQRAGFATALLNYERLVSDEDAIRAMPRAPLADLPMPIIYRGWMLPAAAYARLAEAVAGGGGELLTTPERYRATHELPGWYHLLADVTPQTVWMPLAPGSAPDVAALLALLAPFGHGPVLLKDFVKSRKDEWLEACFIPSASDTAAVERVVTTFVERQGDGLAGGLVFRAFEPFAAAPGAGPGGRPRTVEARCWFLDGRCVATSSAWSDAATQPPLQWCEELAARVPGRFFTMDVAQRADGIWRVIELGDGQVAGLPEEVDVDAFYQALALALGVEVG